MTSSPPNGPARPAGTAARRAVAMAVGVCGGVLVTQLALSTVVLVRPELLGAAEDDAVALARLAPLALVFIAGLAVLVQRAVVEVPSMVAAYGDAAASIGNDGDAEPTVAPQGDASDARAEEIEHEERLAVFRAQRGTRGVGNAMMTREDFLFALERALEVSTNELPVSLVLLRLDARGGDAFELRKAASRVITGLLEEADMAGYLGAGAFGIALPGTEPLDGYDLWRALRHDVGVVARDRGALLEETFVTSTEGETLQSMYGRCVYSLRPVPFEILAT